MSKAIVLLSGGQDSATCLAYALQKHSNVSAVGFFYEQKHSVEIEQAQKLAVLAGVGFEVLDLSIISKLSDNALTNPKREIEVSKESGLPTTFVEGRNLLFLTAASVYAKQRGISTIYIGVCQTDFSGYPDCRLEFVQSAEKTIGLALAIPLQVVTPLMWLTKSETVLLMNRLGKIDWYAYTHTCYEGQRPACGKCPACQLRLKGFSEAGMKDPLPYA